MAVDIGQAFETDLIALAGWSSAAIDPGSTSVTINPVEGGTSTVRATVVAQVDSADLSALITKHAAGA